MSTSFNDCQPSAEVKFGLKQFYRVCIKVEDTCIIFVVCRDVILEEDPAEKTQEFIQSKVFAQVILGIASFYQVLGNSLLMVRGYNMEFIVTINNLAKFL